MNEGNEPLFRGLEALGGLLSDRDQSYSCVVAGGASLAALGVLARVTGDVDVMAVRGETGEITVAPEEFPRFLAEAIREVGRELNLPANWMNTQMASRIQPPGFDERLTWRQFGGLHIAFVGRRDLIALKLDAASDHAPHDRTDVHVEDLVALGATPEEIDEAAQWVRSVTVDQERDAKLDWVKRHVAESRRR